MARSKTSSSKLAKDNMIRAEFVGGETSKKSSHLHSLNTCAKTHAKMTYGHVPPRPQNCPQKHR